MEGKGQGKKERGEGETIWPKLDRALHFSKQECVCVYVCVIESENNAENNSVFH